MGLNIEDIHNYFRKTDILLKKEDTKRLEESLEVIKVNQKNIYDAVIRRPKKFPIYCLLGITLITGIKSCYEISNLKESLQKIPVIQIKNVIGGEAPEKFYEIDGKRVYLEIDSQPVEKYIRKN